MIFNSIFQFQFWIFSFSPSTPFIFVLYFGYIVVGWCFSFWPMALHMQTSAIIIFGPLLGTALSSRSRSKLINAATKASSVAYFHSKHSNECKYWCSIWKFITISSLINRLKIILDGFEQFNYLLRKLMTIVIIWDRKCWDTNHDQSDLQIEVR